ncbi:MAG: nucleotidyltransferase family protein [Planctomycetota bacterium]
MNEPLWECLQRLPALNLPDWYLGAGCIAQTVWNLSHGKAPHADILDYDLVYYDRDLSEERESNLAHDAQELVADLQIELDVTNQARVHIWYPTLFGYCIQPYQSTEDAIGTWPTTATAIGVRPDGAELEVWAPLGTDDLFDLVVRPNRVQITPTIYDAKVARWIARWPSLVALPWNEGVGPAGQRHLGTLK